MPAELQGLKQIYSVYRCWKLLGYLQKPKGSIVINGFVPVFGPKSSLSIHELTAADKYNLDSFPALLISSNHQ